MKDYLDSYSPFTDDKDEVDLSEFLSNELSDMNYGRRSDYINDHSSPEQRNSQAYNLSNTLNWPKIYPLFHYSIDEVPPHMRACVTGSMLSWVLLCTTMFINIINGIVLINADVLTYPYYNLFISLILLCVSAYVPLKFFVLRLYQMLRSGQDSMQNVLILCTIALCVLVEFILVIGFDSSGSIGLCIIFILATEGNIFITILCLIHVGLLSFCIYVQCLVFGALYKKSGVIDGVVGLNTLVNIFVVRYITNFINRSL